MALDKNVTYLDNWDDLIKKSKEIAEEVEREKEDRDVTRTFVDSQISVAEEKDNQEEQAEYAKIYQKIADISAGGGTDLSDYLKKEDAAATYATKSEIPVVEDFVTQQQLQEAVSDKATLDQVAAIDQKVDAIDLTPYAKISDVSAEYAKKSEISGMATEQYVQEQIAELVDGAPEELNSFKELSDALKDQGDAVSAINAVLATKADTSTVYTKTEADAKFLTEHQDLSGYSTTEYVNSEIARVEDEIPSVEGLVSVEQLNEAVALKANSADVEATYAKKSDIPSLNEYATREELTDAVADKATIAQVAAVDQKVDAIDLTPYATKNEVSVFATKEEVADGDASVLNNVLGKMWNKSGDYFQTKKTVNGKTALLWNESDGGGTIFETSDLKSFVGVNDGGDVSTGVHVQIYSKNKADNKGARLNVNPTGIFYGVGTSAVISPETELAVKGDIPSVEGFATTDALNVAVDELNVAIGQKADTVDVSAAVENIETALDEKANVNNVVSKEEYDQLKAQFEYLEQLVMEYAEGAQQEKINDGKIDDLSPDNKAVNITEPMQSVQLPEATVAYTVDVPLKENATVSLTSNKYAYINNTSDEPVDVAFGREVPETESETVANPTIYITGQYDTITVSNVKISQKDTEVNSINNVIITEDNEKTVEITASLADGATITNNSACPVTINNKAVTPEDTEPNSVIVVAPNSTVTVSGGNYGTFESTVGDETLYINKSVSIDTLVVKKGNVIVNDYEIESHIKHIQNDTEYTVTPKIIEVYNQSDWAKSSSTPALYEVMNDLTVTNRIAPGIFGSSAKIKLNGHTITCSDENAAFLLRGSSHYIIENGTIIVTKGYGIWLAGAGTVELKDCNVISEADGGTHCLYIEKANGKFITSGHCRFEITAEEKKYTLNYKDEVWTGGYHDGFLLGEGTEVVGQDVAASMSEPGGPVNMLPVGYHTESFEEDGKTIYRVVKDSE